MSEEDDFGCLSDLEPPEAAGVDVGSPRRKGRPSGKPVKMSPKRRAAAAAPKKQPKGNKAGAEAKKCFASKCCRPKKLNSKFCADHHRCAENMSYQAKAKTPPEMNSLLEVLNDPGKAQIALDDFCRDNPHNGRKKLIDWLSFKRKHGVRVSVTYREGEIEMDILTYWTDVGQPRGWTRQESDDKFELEARKTDALERGQIRRCGSRRPASASRTTLLTSMQRPRSPAKL